MIPVLKLDETFGEQKSVLVSRLRREGFRTVPFDILKSEFDWNRER